MDVATIDFWANVRTSYLHRVSPPTKLAAAALLLAAVLISRDLVVLVAIYLIVLGAMLGTDLPISRIVGLSGYPAVFSILFAVSRWDGTFVTPALVVTKTLAAAVVAIALVATTPYHRLFAPLRYVLPGVVVDVTFLTYRSLFILLRALGDLLTTLRLRGGLSRRHYLQNGRNLAFGLGPLLLRTFGIAERQWYALRLRGYHGRLAPDESPDRPGARDALVLLPATSIFGVALLAQYQPEAVGWLVPLLVSAVLAVGVVMMYLRWRTRRRREGQ